LETQRRELAEETKRLDEKKRQAEAQQAKEEAERRIQERQRERAIQRAKDEEQKQKAVEEEKARQAAALRAKEEERARKATDEEKARKPAQQQAREERRAEEQAPMDRTSHEAVQARTKVAKAESVPLSSPLSPSAQTASTPSTLLPQVAKAFPDTKLQSMLEKFRSAYERRDFDTLQSVSQFKEGRLRNVEFMFSSYTSFQTSIRNLTQTNDGATAQLTLDSAVSVTGETVSLPPLSKTFKLQIIRRGDEWDKVVW
jgi:chromosome segregation ATPase